MIDPNTPKKYPIIEFTTKQMKVLVRKFGKRSVHLVRPKKLIHNAIKAFTAGMTGLTKRLSLRLVHLVNPRILVNLALKTLTKDITKLAGWLGLRRVQTAPPQKSQFVPLQALSPIKPQNILNTINQLNTENEALRQTNDDLLKKNNAEPLSDEDAKLLKQQQRSIEDNKDRIGVLRKRLNNNPASQYKLLEAKLDHYRAAIKVGETADPVPETLVATLLKEQSALQEQLNSASDDVRQNSAKKQDVNELKFLPDKLIKRLLAVGVKSATLDRHKHIQAEHANEQAWPISEKPVHFHYNGQYHRFTETVTPASKITMPKTSLSDSIPDKIIRPKAFVPDSTPGKITIPAAFLVDAKPSKLALPEAFEVDAKPSRSPDTGIFKKPYQTEGVSAHCSTDIDHATNLNTTRLTDDEGNIVFQTVRHGVLSPYGYKNGHPNRKKGALNRAQEAALAALQLHPEKLNAALKGETVNLIITSSSLLTPDVVRHALANSASDEKAMLADQVEALKMLEKQGEIPIRLPSGEIQTLKVQMKVLAFNFGLNRFSQGAAAPLVGGWGASDRLNETALSRLVGLTEGSNPENLATHYLNSLQPGDPNISIIESLMSQIRQIYQNKDHHSTKMGAAKLAALVMALTHIIGGSPIVNCKSGKDRTALAVAASEWLMTRIKLTGKVPKLYPISSADKRLFLEFALQGNHFRIQQANSGAPGYKLDDSILNSYLGDLHNGTLAYLKGLSSAVLA